MRIAASQNKNSILFLENNQREEERELGNLKHKELD